MTDDELAIDPVTGVDPILYRGPTSPSKSQFQRKPPKIDRRDEYAASRSHAATRATVETLSERHRERQVELEEAWARAFHADRHRTAFLENRLATTGVPTLNTMDVLIARQRKQAADAEGHPHRQEQRGDPRHRDNTTEAVRVALRRALGTRQLELMAMGLAHIPEEVFTTLVLQLGGFIREVNISRNALRAIPEGFVRAFAGAERLNYKENHLDLLPEAIQGLPGLRELEADGNQLRRLPPRLPASLTRLVLSRNRLRSLHGAHELVHLIELDLAHNHLELLPPGMHFLTRLRRLVVTGNRLVTLALLPKFSPPTTASEAPGGPSDADDGDTRDNKAAAERREREQREWRVEVDPETNVSVYFHLRTREVTRQAPACFRPPVPGLALGKAARVTEERRRQAPWREAFPEGWEVLLGGQCINSPWLLRGGTAAASAMRSAATPAGSNGTALQSMALRFVDHLTETTYDEILPPPLDNWGELHRLTTLNLAGNQLRELPMSMGKLVQLQTLDAENNRLLELPDVFQELQALTTIRLGMNGLSRLPPSFFSLPNLAELDLKLNRFTSLPDDIAGLRRLTGLDLSSNALEALPKGLLELRKLTRLGLQNNPGLIRSGHYTIETLATGDLERIHWQLRHQLECEKRGGRPPVPESQVIGVGDEVWSTDLHLHKEFTAAVAWAQTTGSLDLHWKNLHLGQFPPSFFTDLAGLRELRLSGHDLEVLPGAFGHLAALRILQLRKNQLRRIEDGVFEPMTSLEELDLEYNRLETFPASIGHLTMLRVLHAANNQLRELPEALGRLHRLQELSLAHNRLTAPPAALGELVALERLDLSYNQLETLGTMAFGALQRLTQLRLNVNRLTELPEGLASAPIRELAVAGNAFTTLPGTILLLKPTLTHLRMQSNKISRLPLAFGELTQLEVVESDGNPFLSPPAEIMNAGIVAIRTYLHKRQERVEEITRLLGAIRYPIQDGAFLLPRLQSLVVRPPVGAALTATTPEAIASHDRQWKHMQFLTDKHFGAFERAVDQYVNGAFYLQSPDVRGADLVNELLLQKQFYLAQAHRERVLRDLLRLCALIRDKRWLDKVDFRYDLERPWGRHGESCGIYVLNPRAVYDDQPELPSVLTVIRKRVYHGFEDEAFDHDEAVVADALEHYLGVYGPVGVLHDDVPFKCGCEELLRFNKRHEPCYRPGWSFVQVVYTPEEATRRVEDERAIAEALAALRPQIRTFLQTPEGEKRFHKEVRAIKNRLRASLKDQKARLKKVRLKHQRLREALEKDKRREAKLEQQQQRQEATKTQGKDKKPKSVVAPPPKTLGDVKAREEQEEQVQKLAERLQTWTDEYEKGRAQLGQGYHAFMEDVITVLLETIGVEVRNHLVRQQRQKAIEFGLRRPWDGPNGRDFEEYKQLVRRKMLSDGSTEKEGGGVTSNATDAAGATGPTVVGSEDRHSDNSEISAVSFEGYDDLVAQVDPNAPGADAGDDDEDDDEDDEDDEDLNDPVARAEALAQLEVSDVSDTDDKDKGDKARAAESEDSDL